MDDPRLRLVSVAALSVAAFASVRQGTRFELEVDGDVTEEHLAAARDAAESVLSNPVIEDVVEVRAE